MDMYICIYIPTILILSVENKRVWGGGDLTDKTP